MRLGFATLNFKYCWKHPQL